MLQITVHPNKRIQVGAPPELTEAKIETLVRKKASWILGKLALVTDQLPEEPKELLNGEKILYLGRRYKIQWSDVTEPSFKAGFYLLPQTIPRAKVVEDFKKRAQHVFTERLKFIKANTGVAAEGFKVVEQKARWGSCDKYGQLRINWKIIMAPKLIIDYVLCHELAHLKIQDHSPKFWKLVEEMNPKYEEHREWLRKNGPILDL